MLILSISISSIIRTDVHTPSRRLHTRVLVAVFTLEPLLILHHKTRLSYFYSKSFTHSYIPVFRHSYKQRILTTAHEFLWFVRSTLYRMSSSWKGRSSYFSGSNTNKDEDGYGGGGQQQYEASSGGKKRPASRLKRSSKQTDKDAEDDEYPNYDTARSDDDNRYTRNGGGGGNNPYYNGGVAVGIPYYGSGGSGTHNSPYSNGGGGYNSPYNNGGGSSKSSPYSNESGGYGNSSPYRNDSGYGNSSPYNVPASSYMIPQDGTRLPVVIQAKEVNVYGTPPGSQYDTDNYNDQRGRGDGGGFFGPALQAVGHFFDRKFGLHDRE
jgi:hypothetical protein